MYRLTIITAPLSDVEGTYFLEIEVDADRCDAFADTLNFIKGGVVVLQAPRSGVIVEVVK